MHALIASSAMTVDIHYITVPWRLEGKKPTPQTTGGKEQSKNEVTAVCGGCHVPPPSLFPHPRLRFTCCYLVLSWDSKEERELHCHIDCRGDRDAVPLGSCNLCGNLQYRLDAHPEVSCFSLSLSLSQGSRYIYSLRMTRSCNISCTCWGSPWRWEFNVLVLTRGWLVWSISGTPSNRSVVYGGASTACAVHRLCTIKKVFIWQRPINCSF